MKHNQPARETLAKISKHPNRSYMLYKNTQPDVYVSDTVWNRTIREALCLTYLDTKHNGHRDIAQIAEPSVSICKERPCPWIRICEMAVIK